MLKSEFIEDYNNGNHQKGNKIGTLREKSLHAVIKHYFEPNELKHEIKVGKYYADIVNENGIFEIQTGNFNKLRNKLDFFLQFSPVTIIYPIAKTKWISWIDAKTFEITKKRKSPKIGTPLEVFIELYKIKYHLFHPNLRICILMIELEEYRMQKKEKSGRKNKFSRYERIPMKIVEKLLINNSHDFHQLIPQNLSKNYTVQDFIEVSGLSIPEARITLHILNYLRVIRRIGKQRNAIIYQNY